MRDKHQARWCVVVVTKLLVTKLTRHVLDAANELCQCMSVVRNNLGKNGVRCRVTRFPDQ